MNDPAAMEELVRARCLALPETSETDSWGHPNFRVGKKTFVSLESRDGRPYATFRLGADAVQPLLLLPDFFDPPYSRGQWVAIWLDCLPDDDTAADLVEQAWRSVALKRQLKLLAISQVRVDR